jgi:hypothetical protein
MSSYSSSYSFASTEKIRYVNKADPSWSIDKKIAWLKRREYLRMHKDAYIPDNCREDKEYHRWWHTKGKYQTMKHYVDGEQVIY